MEYQAEIDHFFGFSNQALAEKLIKADLAGLSDEMMIKVGLIIAQSGYDQNKVYMDKSMEILKSLNKRRNKTDPLMLLKWVINFNKTQSENLAFQIRDWAETHPDRLDFARASLWSHKYDDNITKIGNYVKHLEIFWDDDIAWYKLGKLYEKEKLPERAIFAYEEAISIYHEDPLYYIASAKARLELKDGSEETSLIARKMLSKALMLDPKNLEVVDLLISLNGPNTNKLVEYRKTLSQQ